MTSLSEQEEGKWRETEWLDGSGVRSHRSYATLGLTRQAWCHRRTHDWLCDIISEHPHHPLKKQNSSPSLPPSRGWARSGQTVFSLFCQQSFLKEIFFQRSCFCLFCMVVWGLCLSVHFSSCSVERSSWSFTNTLNSWGFLIFFVLFFFFYFL